MIPQSTTTLRAKVLSKVQPSIKGEVRRVISTFQSNFKSIIPTFFPAKAPEKFNFRWVVQSLAVTLRAAPIWLEWNGVQFFQVFLGMRQSFPLGVIPPSLLYYPGHVHFSLTLQGWADGVVVLFLWALQITQVSCSIHSAQEVLRQGVKDIDTVDLIKFIRLNYVVCSWLKYKCEVYMRRIIRYEIR